jgi:hypothetical protein
MDWARASTLSGRSARKRCIATAMLLRGTALVSDMAHAPRALRRAHERLTNKVRDFFGTFGAAVCALVPFRSHNGIGGSQGAFRNLLIFKGFAGCGEAA